MERLNDTAQWIILMAFLVSIGIFFLALVINQSTVIGQTTAEGVLEFPKNDIQDLRQEIFVVDEKQYSSSDGDEVRKDIVQITLHRKNAVVNYTIWEDAIMVSGRTLDRIDIYYYNGVTSFNETAHI